MTKTNIYNLKKPEPTDPLRLEDFNENADILDGLLNSLNTAVEGLDAAAKKFGNCHIASGTYKGTGKYGSANPTTIEVGFAPKIVIIFFEHFEDQHCRMFVWPGVKHDLCSAFSSAEVTQIWGETSFGQYCTVNDYGQMNYSGYTYSYIVIG